jgi:hypothetical protein
MARGALWGLAPYWLGQFALVGLADEGDEGVVWRFMAFLCPLSAVTFFRIRTMPALSEDPSILSWTASHTPDRGINLK